MNIVSCEHPLLVHNPYLDKDISVPCGKCNTCLTNKSSLWVSRLEVERHNSPYTAFFTLTYAPKYLPCLTLGWSENAFLPDKMVHVKRDFTSLPNKRNLSDEYNTFEISVTSSILAEQSTKNIMRLHADTLPYVSVYDAQTFIKRVRSKLYRRVYGTDKGLQDTQKIRYFLVSEYGPTGLAPHYHGLFFFDDPRYASYLSDVLSESWQFGRIDFKYVQSSATSYVAQYVNCTSNLPRVYRDTALRPFCLCSRHRPIGLPKVKDETVSELFNTSSCLMPIESPEKGTVSYVPLWRTIEDRLYPKLPFNSSLSDSLRHELFRVFTSFSPSSFQEFCEETSLTVSSLVSNGHISNLVVYLHKILPEIFLYDSDYVSLLHFLSYSDRFKRLYYVIRRIHILLYRYDISLVVYMRRYDTYFSNKALYSLKVQYIFEENFVVSSDVRFLVNIDPVFFNRIRYLSFNDLTPHDMLTLYGFGFSYSELKIVFNDEKCKKSYFRQLHFSRSFDYLEMSSLRAKIVNDSRKVRRKNEYLEKHPELRNLY